MTTAASAAPTVNTKQSDRRKLRFESPEQMWADVDRIVAAERAGKLRRTGNWTVGQNFGHIAAFINFAYDGYPSQPPWIVKLVMGMMKNRYINRGLPGGVKIPGVKGGTWGIEPRSLDDGLATLKAAWARLRAKAPTEPNPLFGAMTHEEWIKLHLRHAELHLSFLHPE